MEGFPSSDNEVSDEDVFANISQNSDFDQDDVIKLLQLAHQAQRKPLGKNIYMGKKTCFKSDCY